VWVEVGGGGEGGVEVGRGGEMEKWGEEGRGDGEVGVDKVGG